LIRFALRSTLGLCFGSTSFSVSFGSFFSKFGKILLGEFDLTIIIKLNFGLLLFSFSITCTLAFLKLLGINSVSNGGHGFSLAIGDEVANHFLRDKSNLVDDVESTSFELEDSAFLEVTDTSLSNGFVLDLGVFVYKVFNVVSLFNFGFGNQVIVLNQSDFDSGFGVGSHPGKFLGFLEIFIGLVNGTVQYKVGTIRFLLSDGYVTPLHEGHLITDLHISGIITFNPGFTAVKNRFGANISVFRVKGLRASLNRAGAILDVQLAGGVLADASVAGHFRVNDVFVSGPNFVPLHQTSVAGGSLLKHKIFQGFNCHTLAHNTLHGGEARIVPAIDVSLFDEPLKFALGEDGRDELELGEIVNFARTEFENLLYPFVERVTISVLDGAERVSDTLETINDWDCQIVSWVSFVGRASPMVRSVFASVEDRVS
jgi:hypothetical protein